MRTLSLLRLLPAILPPCLLAACSDPIPAVEDPHRIVVDGQPMTAMAFTKRYCQGQVLHPSCVAVNRAIVANASRGPMPRGW